MPVTNIKTAIAIRKLKSKFPKIFLYTYKVQRQLSYKRLEKLVVRLDELDLDEYDAHYKQVYEVATFLKNRGLVLDDISDIEKAFELQDKLIVRALAYDPDFLANYTKCALLLGKVRKVDNIFNYLWRQRGAHHEWMIKVAFDLGYPEFVEQYNKENETNYRWLRKRRLSEFNKVFSKTETFTQSKYPFISNKTQRYYQPKNCSVIEELFVAKVSDAIVDSRFSIFANNEFVVYENGVDPSRGFNAGLWDYYYGSNYDLYSVLLNSKPVESESMELNKGIHLFGRVNSNIFHFLLEYLPRLRLLVESQASFKDYKVIVPESLYFQFFELFKAVLPSELEVVVMKRNSIFKVKELLVPSINTFLDDTQNEELSNCGLYSSDNLKFLQRACCDLVTSAEEISSIPEKIYLCRDSGGARGLVNERAVRKFLRARGFVPIDPAKLNITQQIAVFRKAKIVIGVAGAAFSFLFLANKELKAISFVAEENKGYSIQPTLASFSGCTHVFVCGEKILSEKYFSSKQASFHSEFNVKLENIQASLDFLEI